jgi:hypothetical protein
VTEPRVDFPQPTLPVAVGPPDRLLVDGGGKPVWPVTAAEAAQLHATGAAFGFAPREVDASEVDDEPAGAGMVIGLGADSAPLARLYAHLTHRSWAPLERLDELPSPDGFDVLVTSQRCLTSPLLDALYSPELERAPGLVHAVGHQALRLQVLARSAAAAIGGDPACHRIDVFPFADIDREQLGASTALGAATSRADLVAAFGEGHTVLTVCSHSDGIDADLGPHLVMCPMDTTWQQWTGGNPPTCQVTDQCYRLGRPIADVAGSGLLLHPREIAARAFIFNACVGVMPTDSTCDPDFGLGVGLMANHRIGALLTSWRPTLGRPDSTELLARSLMDGMPVGTALAQHNALHESLETGHRLCLFGDPDLRVVPGQPDLLAKRDLPGTGGTSSPPRLSDPVPRRSPESQIALVRACLTGEDKPRPGSTPSLASMPEEMADALSAIDAYEASLTAPAGSPPPPADAGTAMRRAVADLIAQRGRFCDIWLRHASESRMLALVPRCDGCTNSTVRYEVDFELSAIEPRQLEICPRCGFTRDLPTGFEMGVQVDPSGLVRLDASLHGESWAGALTTQHRWPLPTRARPWPAGPDGLPVQELRLLDRLEPAPMVVTVTIVAGTRVLLASRAVRFAGDAGSDRIDLALS